MSWISEIQMQRKVERIKVSRDYSFLSDEAVLPAPKKEPITQNVSVPKSGVLLLCTSNLNTGSWNLKYDIFIEKTYTGFLLMFKRRNQLKYHQGANNLWAVMAEAFMLIMMKGK